MLISLSLKLYESLQRNKIHRLCCVSLFFLKTDEFILGSGEIITHEKTQL